tara:strand:+ start:18449 stop:18946 length:498 start_codon:yes stop_codon:yes gene_type:complete
MHPEMGLIKQHEEAMLPGSALARNLVMLAAYVKELQVQSHLIHLNYEGSNFLEMHKFLKKRYQKHLDQFDVIGEFVRAMDYMMPLCACGLKDALGPGCFANVESHDGRSMLLTYHQNLCDLCEIICAIEPMAQEMKALDVANYLVELMEDANKSAWFIKASLRCG